MSQSSSKLDASAKTLSPDQEAAFTVLLDYVFNTSPRKGPITLGGLAGTGKTTVISRLILEIEKRKKELGATFTTRYPHLQLDIYMCAYTGKAVDRLMSSGRSMNVVFCTLHSYLAAIIREDEKQEKRSTGFQSRRASIVIIDEASMLPKEMYDFLVRDLALGQIQKLILVGDHGQLPPISDDRSNAFNAVSEDRLDIKLETIHRQAAENPLIRVAHDIRKCTSLQEIQTIVRECELKKVTEQEALRGAEYYAAQRSWNDIIILTYTNASRVKINSFMCSRYQSAVGLPVINLKNIFMLPDGVSKRYSLPAYRMGNVAFIANGARGLLQSPPVPARITHRVAVWKETSIKFRGRKEKTWINRTNNVIQIDSVDFQGLGEFKNLETWPNVWNSSTRSFHYTEEYHIMHMDWAFAITCHKAQGSSWPIVLIWLNDVNTSDIDFLKKWLYTALTRAEEKAVFVV